MKKILFVIIFIAIVFPSISFAQQNSNPYVDPNQLYQGNRNTYNESNAVNQFIDDPSLINSSANQETYDTTENADLFNAKANDTYDPNSDLYAGGKTTGKVLNSCNRDVGTYKGLVNYLACIINNWMTQIAITLAVVYFIWGVVQYVLAADNVEERKKSRQTILWGVIAIFTMVSIWGIVKLIRTTLGLL